MTQRVGGRTQKIFSGCRIISYFGMHLRAKRTGRPSKGPFVPSARTTTVTAAKSINPTMKHRRLLPISVLPIIENAKKICANTISTARPAPIKKVFEYPRRCQRYNPSKTGENTRSSSNSRPPDIEDLSRSLAVAFAKTRTTIKNAAVGRSARNADANCFFLDCSGLSSASNEKHSQNGANNVEKKNAWRSEQ